MRRDDALLLDMLIAARKIGRYVSDLTEQDFYASDLVQSAVMRELQVIGEAVRMVSEETKSLHTGIAWQAIAGMRNRIVHEYFNIRLEVVWQTVIESIPPLATELERLVPPEDDSGDGADNAC